MSLRISVDLDGMRWADLYRFVDLARGGGVGPDEPVDILTFGSESIPASLSAKLYPGAEGVAVGNGMPAGAMPELPSRVPPPPLPPGQNGHGQHGAPPPFTPFERPPGRPDSGPHERGRPDGGYVDEFARLQEGLARPVRRGEDDRG